MHHQQIEGLLVLAGIVLIDASSLLQYAGIASTHLYLIYSTRQEERKIHFFRKQLDVSFLAFSSTTPFENFINIEWTSDWCNYFGLLSETLSNTQLMLHTSLLFWYYPIFITWRKYQGPFISYLCIAPSSSGLLKKVREAISSQFR